MKVDSEIDGKRRLLIGETYQENNIEPPTNAISKKDYASNFDDFLEKASPDQPLPVLPAKV